MQPSSDQLVEHVGSGESLEAVYAATLAERAGWTPVLLGVTDRRLFYVSDDGWFGNLDYSSICTVRGRPRVTRTYCFDDYRLVAGAGGLAAVLGFLGAAAFSSTLLVPFLLLAAVCGLVTAEYLRRHADVDIGAAGLGERLADLDVRETLRRFREDITGRADPSQLLLLGSGLLAIASLVGTVALASNWVVVFGAFALVVGLGLVDYGYRHRHEFDGWEVARHRETTMTIITSDDRTIRFRTDESADIPAVVGRLVAERQHPETTTR